MQRRNAMENNVPSLPKLVKAFRTLRDKRSQIKSDFEEEDKRLSAKQDKIKAVLLDHCRENDIDSVRTAEGTFMRKKKVSYWTSDWEKFFAFIKEHQIPEVLQKRISQSNLEEFLNSEENKELIPQGLNQNAEYTITVQKPRGKK